MKAFLGGDPGRSGGFAVVTDMGHVEAWPMPDTEVDTLRLCRDIAEKYPGVRGWVERVNPMPGQGVRSMFTFGGAYAEMRMGLLAAGIGFDDVQPKAWQKAFSMSKNPGEAQPAYKKRLKARAQQLYPSATKATINDNTADAVLIAYACMKASV